MLTYQVRPRVLRFAGEKVPDFPAQGKISFHLQPLQPFGATADGGRTAVQAVKASTLFNANTGAHTVESADPLSPLDLLVKEPSRDVELKGTVMTISQEFSSAGEMHALIEGVAYVFPSILNVSFYDPPYVERVDGELAGENFRWELVNWRMEFGTTTQEKQEKHVATAWERIEAISESKKRRRLTAALHYFHVACRLSSESVIAGEFMAESVLNLAKSLEVLFPPDGDGKTRDAVRAALRTIGYEDEEIERHFIPAMALRDSVDVAHVGLCIFTRDQLQVIHGYVESAEWEFRKMFQRIFVALEKGEYEIAPYEISKPNKDVVDIIDRIRASAVEAEVVG